MTKTSTLAAIDAFRAVVATNAADASCPDGLAIDNASARLRIAPDGRAELLAQDGVQVLPGAVQTPEPEIAVACSPPPEGRKRWTLRLLADKLVKRVSTPSRMRRCGGP